MKIHVGSKNQTKVQAVRDTIALYPNLFSEPEVTGIDIDVHLFGHPKSLDETVQGAIDRAKKAFIDCEYSFWTRGRTHGSTPQQNWFYGSRRLCNL